MVDIVRIWENTSSNWAGGSLEQTAAAPGLIDYGSQGEITGNKGTIITLTSLLSAVPPGNLFSPSPTTPKIKAAT